MKIIFILISIFSQLSYSQLIRNSEEEPIDFQFKNIEVVDQNIIRGGYVFVFDNSESAKFSEFKEKYNIKKVLVLGPSQDNYGVVLEKTAALKNGLEDVIAIEVSICATPIFCPYYSDETIASVLATMIDEDNLPLFVHCLAGKDRTGLFIALYESLFLQKSSTEVLQNFENHAGFNNYWPFVFNIPRMIRDFTKDKKSQNKYRELAYAELAKRKNLTLEEVRNYYNTKFTIISEEQ